ncbi:uncharacterized protein LOC130613595 [Hydractinia symbiolongicarpus]|uniref:uncharacterized protein LOC130613595 n=1 Tax=Hydractinia symbiolongicarpus TaxID=13093 RepID=UPI00254F6315|nr:uncharacterized protein LOC130613595 [Hydractinia symbiolongicarpus]
MEWDYPKCVGAIDGNQVCIKAPASSGLAYYTYKFFSMVLMEICDAKNCFAMVDIGSYGRDNDASILNEIEIYNAFQNNLLNLPEHKTSLKSKLPQVVIGDGIFALKPWLMKPFPGKNLSFEERIYNYRLSRARTTIGNTFGILAAKWRIF